MELSTAASSLLQDQVLTVNYDENVISSHHVKKQETIERQVGAVV